MRADFLRFVFTGHRKLGMDQVAELGRGDNRGAEDIVCSRGEAEILEADNQEEDCGQTEDEEGDQLGVQDVA